LPNRIPGHLDILASFSPRNCLPARSAIGNFDQLHAAWEDVFNVELLNKRFYEELSNWYFWARKQVSFPDDLGADDEHPQRHQRHSPAYPADLLLVPERKRPHPRSPV
jgi:adenine-specific DNA-methyltransferase